METAQFISQSSRVSELLQQFVIIKLTNSGVAHT
eukprot:gene1983-3001_t